MIFKGATEVKATDARNGKSKCAQISTHKEQLFSIILTYIHFGICVWCFCNPSMSFGVHVTQRQGFQCNTSPSLFGSEDVVWHDKTWSCCMDSIWHLYCTLLWRHNDHDGVSNHQPNGCLLNRLFRRRSKKTSKIRVTGLCAGNSPGPVNSPQKGPVTAENVSIWWRHHECRRLHHGMKSSTFIL